MSLKFISWNVNGLRACLGKGFYDVVAELAPDFICLQETKMQPGQAQVELEGCQQVWNWAEKKGYSGTAVFAKQPPQEAVLGMGIDRHDREGRLITLRYPGFFLVNCYTPNAQEGLARIDYRMDWEDCLRDYLTELAQERPVVFCGDLNVAHQEIDLRHPKANRGNAGFSDQERAQFGALLESGFTDSFRHLYPRRTDAYSWWSWRRQARASNAGWRIDYFLVSNSLAGQIQAADIYPQCMGSDHCPVGLVLPDSLLDGPAEAPLE